MTRTRSSETNQIVSSTITYTYPLNGNVRQSPSTGNVDLKRLVKSMTDEVVEDFHKRSKQGEIFNNPMLRQDFTESQTLLPWYNYLGVNTAGAPSTWPTSGFVDQGTMSGSRITQGIAYMDPPSIDLSALQGIAVTSAWANMDFSKADALVSLAEAQKTVNSMTSILSRLVRILTDLRYTLIRITTFVLKPAQLAKAIRDAYLEARYAIRPLVYDVQNIIDASMGSNPRPTRMTSRGSAKDSQTVSDSGQSTSTFSSVLVNYTRTTTRTVDVRAGVLWHVNLRTELDALSRWGVLNFSGTAWELIPFSFMIDWIFNVGKTIAAWTPTCGASALTSWSVIEDSLLQSVSVSSVAPVPNQYTNQSSRGRTVTGSGARSKFSLTKIRTPVPDRPILPQFVIKLDTLKILDFIAIANGLISNLPRARY